MNITAISLGGQTIELGTEVQQQGRGGKSDDALKAMLAPMWVLFARGNSAKLKAGELFQAQVEHDICFAPQDGSMAAVPCPQTAAPIATVPAG